MSYLDGLRDGCRLCLAKVKAAVTREAAIKEIRALLRLVREGNMEKLKEMLKRG
jgi:predicted nucleotidyltransferase